MHGNRSFFITFRGVLNRLFLLDNNIYSDMAHDHNHGHSSSKNIAVAFFLNLGFSIFEFVGGLYTNSVAITSDALHDLGDAVSLGVSWYFERVSRRGPSAKFSYGRRRFSVMAAIINSLVLLAGSMVILWESVPRLWNPVATDAVGMFWFAVVGIVVNGVAVLRLRGGESLNERVVGLHLLEDVLGWAAVLVGSVVIYFFDVPIVDPLLSVGITLFILWNVYRNLRSAARVILQAVPEGVDVVAVRDALALVAGVKSVHDLHVWSMDGEYMVLSVHVQVVEGADYVVVKRQVRDMLAAKYDIEHATIEVDGPGCECEMVDCN